MCIRGNQHLLEQPVQVELSVHRDHDGIEQPRQPVAVLDGVSVYLVVDVEAADVLAVALDDVDDLTRDENSD